MKIKVLCEYNSSLLSNILSFFMNIWLLVFALSGILRPLGIFHHEKVGSSYIYIYTFIMVCSYLHSENTIVPKSTKKGWYLYKKGNIILLLYTFIIQIVEMNIKLLILCDNEIIVKKPPFWNGEKFKWYLFVSLGYISFVQIFSRISPIVFA